MGELLSRMKHKHGRIIDGRRHFWDVEKLWELSKNLRPIPTIRNVALHCQRIINAKMEYPILLCSDGQLIDGGHRVAKALIDEKSEIDAVYITLLTADVIQ